MAESPAPVKRPGCFRRRFLTVIAAVAAAVGVYYLEKQVLGIDLVSPSIDNRPSREITVDDVFGAALIASVVGWIGIAIMEGMHRVISRRARAVWTVVAIIAFLLSLAAPFTGTGVDMKTRLGLAALHLTVGVILIPLIPDWPPRRERIAAAVAV